MEPKELYFPVQFFQVSFHTQTGLRTATGLDYIALGEKEEDYMYPVHGISNICLGQVMVIN